jgi:hypothetical protein
MKPAETSNTKGIERGSRHRHPNGSQSTQRIATAEATQSPQAIRALSARAGYKLRASLRLASNSGDRNARHRDKRQSQPRKGRQSNSPARKRWVRERPRLEPWNGRHTSPPLSPESGIPLRHQSSFTDPRTSFLNTQKRRQAPGTPPPAVTHHPESNPQAHPSQPRRKP